MANPNFINNPRKAVTADISTFVPSRECFLCGKFQKIFYCKRCINNGNFLHSTSRFSERFAEKRLRLLRIYNEKDDYANEFNKLLSAPRNVENTIEDIRARREKIRILNMMLQETRNKVEKQRRELMELRRFNGIVRLNLDKNYTCKEELEIRIKQLLQRQPVLINNLNIVKPQLKKLKERRIKELFQYIFPINQVNAPKSNSCEDSLDDIQVELADATRTAYVRGRWVFTDSWGETQHSIVAPTLPDSGDYSAYINWILSTKDSTAMTSSEHNNCAYNIRAALIYTTQLVSILAHILDINLPNRLSYSEFCEHDLNERRFMRLITRLNANVLYLCLSQDTHPSKLHPIRTIRNILLLLDHKSSDLGRQDFVEVEEQYASFFEEQLDQQMKEAANRLTSESEDHIDQFSMVDQDNCDDSLDYDSDNYLSVEWETVPLVSCPEASPGSCSSRKPHLSTTPTTNMASGLVTSAAAGIASIWRGWTNNK